MYMLLDLLLELHIILIKQSLCVAQLADFADLASLQNYTHKNFCLFQLHTRHVRQKYEVKIRGCHITAIQSNEYIEHIFHLSTILTLSQGAGSKAAKEQAKCRRDSAGLGLSTAILFVSIGGLFGG